ncbi:hypothetical protein [Phytohabitans houttuyneae]|uniref:Uncharacterized protein n=1 Tax=Phytohabitans houttuyneae TaxID=1076126 RepID=A0A6V8KVL9_9ACTN|nr:hypothetical protein [Phytohabitans houttuyneae]GFJ85847.1 hypothetical protein Phou_100270 [Phytohabitans houttuyneae]
MTNAGNLRGARIATTELAAPPAGPVQVERRVLTDGIVMVTRQRIRVGRTQAGKLLTILVEDTHLRVLHNGEDLALHPRLEYRPRHPVQGLPNRLSHQLIMSIMSRNQSVQHLAKPHTARTTSSTSRVGRCSQSPP